MDPFLSIEAILAAAEAGSFGGGARSLGVTPAAISKAIARAEDELQLRLFDRTTRSVQLTPEGRLYVSHCRRAMDEMVQARERMQQMHRVVGGELVVALSSVLSASLGPRLGSFTELYPGLSVRLVFGDRRTRLVEEQVDVALRIGPLGESCDVAFKLGQFRWATVASPAYLERRGYPPAPGALASHDCLVYQSVRGQQVAWVFLDERGKSTELNVSPRMRSNDGRALVDAARGGAGIVQVFHELVAEDLRVGRLVPLFPELMPLGPPLHALCKSGQRKSPKVRAFVDFLRGAYRDLD